jgi:hypothetical protein
LFGSFSRLSEILPIFFFILFQKRNKGGGLWVIFCCCLASFLIDFNIGSIKQHVPLFYVYSLFTTVEYGLFSVFLYLSLKEKYLKYSVIVCSVFFCIVAFINILHKHTGNTGYYDSLTMSVEAILIIVYSILFLYEQIKEPNSLYIYKSKKFWIIIGLLLYFSSTLFLFIYAANLTKQEYYAYWAINDIFNILKNILFSISFLIKEGKTQESPLENLYADI